MSPEREQLLGRFLEGSLTAQDEAALLAILEKDPGAADELAGLLRLDEGVREALVPEASAEALSRAVLERLNDSGRTDRFAREVVERLRSETPRTGTRRIRRPRRRGVAPAGPRPWIAALAAAGALMALLVLATVTATRPAKSVAVQPRPKPVLPEPELPAPVKRIETPLAPGPRPLPGEKVELRDPEPFHVPLPRPSPLQPPPPLPTPEPLREAEPKPSTVAEAVVIAWLEEAGGRRGIPAGQGFEAAGPAALIFADGTRLEILPGTKIQEITEARGKRLFVAQGTVAAQVEKQPAGQPMVFATPHGEAQVLGTALRLIVEGASTQLEVTEGLVRLVRNSDRSSIEVKAGRRSEIVRGVTLATQPLPLDEIVILAKTGVASNGDWRKVPDAGAAGGVAFEAWQEWNGLAITDVDRMKKSPGYVDFTFRADPDKEYSVWVRGRCTSRKEGEGFERFRFDYAALQFETAEVTSIHLPIPESKAYKFNGWGNREGFWWIGGEADALLDETKPLMVKFARPGPHKLRVYAIESPMQIDAIWLSATQKSRPRPEQRGPERK